MTTENSSGETAQPMQCIKHLSLIVAVILGIGGFIGLWLDFPEFMEKTFYKSEQWTGNFSTNTEYSIITGDFPPAPEDQGNIIFRLQSKEGTGAVHGDMISEGLCQHNPITWYIFIDSEKPLYTSFGKKRDFTVSYLQGGKKVPVALIQMTLDEVDDVPPIIKGEVIGRALGLKFPDVFVAGKDLTAFDQDVADLNKLCADITEKFHIEQMKIRNAQKKSAPPSGPAH